MEFKEAVGAFIAGVVILIPAVKWLIHDWAKKARELDELKAAHTKNALGRLENDIKDFRSAIDTIREQLRNLASTMVAHRGDIASLKLSLQETQKALDVYSKGFSEQIRNQIKTEVSDLTQKLMLIRNKKNGV
jgi:predicted  nucleic acid-binding Zn-ribbon protein